MSSPSTANPFTFPTARTDGRVCGLATVSSCTRPWVMAAVDSHCPDPVRAWRTSELLRSSSATEARVTAITMKRKPPSGWRRLRITSSSSGQSSKRSRLATYSPEYRDAKCACVVLKRDHVELYVNFILVDFPPPAAHKHSRPQTLSLSLSLSVLYMLPTIFMFMSRSSSSFLSTYWALGVPTVWVDCVLKHIRLHIVALLAICPTCPLPMMPCVRLRCRSDFFDEYSKLKQYQKSLLLFHPSVRSLPKWFS